MKIIKRMKKCGCCGAEFEGEVCCSRYSGDHGLDNKPMDAENFPIIEMCPRCGYYSFSIEKAADDRVRTVVGSEEYKEILTSEYASEMLKALYAMLALTEDQKQQEYLHMLLCWVYENAGQKKEAVEERKLAVEQMERQYFNPDTKEAIPVEAFMVYFDCLRQLGEWGKLGKVIGEVEDDIRQHLKPEHLICRILEFEKNAIKNGDTAPHSIQEV